MAEYIKDYRPWERKAILEKLAMTLEGKADFARRHGNEKLETALRTVGEAVIEATEEFVDDVAFVEDVAAKAVSLLVTFHCLYPEHPVGHTLQ